jgi:hypothetical protein
MVTNTCCFECKLLSVTQCSACVRKRARKSHAQAYTVFYLQFVQTVTGTTRAIALQSAEHRAVTMSLHASRQALHSNAQWRPMLPTCIGKHRSIVIQAQSQQAQATVVGEPVQQQQAKQQLLQPQDAYPLVDIRTQTKYARQIFWLI